MTRFFGIFVCAWLTASTSAETCRCTPTDSCWPSQEQWQSLNASIAGQLIRDRPIARACYPGPLHNAAECARINRLYPNTTFQQNSPIGYTNPISLPCPPVNASAGEEPGACTLGNAPVYTVNATKPSHISKGIAFARQNNLRLVIRDTGHDLLGRSTGYGSLQIWMRYLRTGIVYQDAYKPTYGCGNSQSWTGSAFKIGGGYVWSDVYAEANKRNLVVVGGGTPSVGCIGGWMQGGGHSPATHDFGLGADQVLEAQVVLADGSLVTASPCTNRDLFFAIRGGGGGTYGILTSTTIKAWPSRNVVVQTLAMAPLTDKDMPKFMQALADLYSSLPSLNDGGFSGYGTWSIASPVPIFANFTAGYTHAFATMGKSLQDSKDVAAPLVNKLRTYNGTSLAVSITYTAVASYKDYYNQFSGMETPSGNLGALGSRFFDKAALRSNRTALAKMLEVVAGTPKQQTSNNLVFATGGRVFTDARTSYSGVNPAWRTAYLHHIVARSYTEDTPKAQVEAIQNDITHVKVGAMRKLAPNTGSYMNEGDRLDPQYQTDFYGANFGRLSEIKATYDADGRFYCPTCVGSEDWVEQADGKLCRA